NTAVLLKFAAPRETAASTLLWFLKTSSARTETRETRPSCRAVDDIVRVARVSKVTILQPASAQLVLAGVARSVHSFARLFAQRDVGKPRVHRGGREELLSLALNRLRARSHLR